MNHRLIGPLTPYNGADGVYMTINGATTFVRIGRPTDAAGNSTSSSNFVWSTLNTVNFETADCSG